MDKSVETATTDAHRPPSRLLRAVTWALRPLVKLMLHRGVGYQEFAEQLKVIFVDVAAKEFALPGKRETDSRISVLTGIYRRDVKRIRALLQDQDDEAVSELNPSEEMSLSAKVMGLWTGLPEYTLASGEPKPLHRLASKGGEASFESLVRRVSKDLHSRTLLDEWQRIGAVFIDEEHLVHLREDAFMFGKSLDEKSFYLQNNAHDHLAALTHNVTGNEPPMLERCVIYRQLTPAAITELSELAKQKGMEALHAVNQRALELKAKPDTPDNAIYRFNFGTYFYQDTPLVQEKDPSDD